MGPCPPPAPPAPLCGHHQQPRAPAGASSSGAADAAFLATSSGNHVLLGKFAPAAQPAASTALARHTCWTNICDETEKG